MRAAALPPMPGSALADARQFLPVLAQLGLLLAVFKVYRIAGRALPHGSRAVKSQAAAPAIAGKT